MNKPKVSIILSAYNHKPFVAKCIDSVINQTYKDFEFIIFDDCSTDGTFEIIQSYNDDRIKLFRAPYNRGMVENINEAIKISTGEYIAHINSDDCWESSKLEKQVEFLQKNDGYGVVFTLARLIDRNGKLLSDKNSPFSKASNMLNYQWLRHFFYYGNCLCFTSAMIRKSCYDKVGLYNPAYIVLLDFDMWIRVLMGGYEIYIIEEKLTDFRFSSGLFTNLSRKVANSRSFYENGLIFDLYSKINSKEKFMKIFPEYDESKLLDEKLDYNLFMMVIEKYESLKNLSTISKIEHKIIKRLHLIKDYALYKLVNKIAYEDNSLTILKQNFNFSFKNYLRYTEFIFYNQNKISLIESKNKKLIRFLLRFYFVVSTTSILILLIK